MHRFYVAARIERDEVSIADAKQIHHLKRVLRLQINDEVILFDGEGNEYLALLTRLSLKEAVLSIKASRPARSDRVKITVACALPKKDKMDEIIDQLTQLGVDGIIPMETERVIVKLDSGQKQARLERWRRIAQSAAQQSQRNTLPLVAEITPIKEVLAQAQDFGLKLIATLAATRQLREALAESKPSRILVLIGPEGDFSPPEIELAKSEGFIPVSLGSSTLRVETAAVAVASYISLSMTG